MKAYCPLCKTGFDKAEYVAHMLIEHGWDEWKIKQRWAQRESNQPAPETPAQHSDCQCRPYRAGLACEFAILWKAA